MLKLAMGQFCICYQVLRGNRPLHKRLDTVIRSVFALTVPELDPAWTSDDLPQWDSVGHLNLIVAIEKEFNVKIEIEEMFDVQSLGDIEPILRKKGAL
jgi:acyl carrier protein